MKKIVFIICLILSNTSIIYASSGALKQNSIVECDGIYFGYHASDNHYHKAIKNDSGTFIASGDIIDKIPCDNKINNNTNVIIEIKLYKCVDGDTAKFYINGDITTVRFLAIDTPESTKILEPFGKEASDYTCQKLRTANVIKIEYDNNSNKTDKYNRDLGWIYVDNELLQNSLVKEGLAEIKYIYGDYKYLDLLNESEKYAKKNNLKIWSDYKDTSFLNYILIGLFLIYAILKLIKQNKKI